MIIIGALIFRMAGVALCMAGTKLKLKERVFCMLAYTPKATVQAAIGGVPLSMGLREITTYKWLIEGDGQIRP